jgi:hypothetical protein
MGSLKYMNVNQFYHHQANVALEGSDYETVMDVIFVCLYIRHCPFMTFFAIRLMYYRKYTNRHYSCVSNGETDVFSSYMTYFYVEIMVLDVIPSSLVYIYCWSSEQPKDGSINSHQNSCYLSNAELYGVTSKEMIIFILTA